MTDEFWPDLPREAPRLRLGEASAKRIIVLSILADGEWHSGVDLSQPETGGTEGLRRLRELTAMGYDIERRGNSRTAWDYRWRKGEDAPPTHGHDEPRCESCYRDGIATVLHALGWPFDLGYVPSDDQPEPFVVDDDLIERVAGLYLASDDRRLADGKSRFIVDSEALADYVDTVMMELDR